MLVYMLELNASITCLSIVSTFSSSSSGASNLTVICSYSSRVKSAKQYAELKIYRLFINDPPQKNCLL